MALSICLLYLTNIIPINKLFILGLSSCLITICILITNTKISFLVYLGVSLLSFFLLPNKGIAISYLIIFGLYGFVKYFVECKRNVPIEFLLKLLYFNVSLLISYSLYSALFIHVIKINLPIYGLLIVLQVIFIIYDYALTTFIAYANKNILRKIK